MGGRQAGFSLMGSAPIPRLCAAGCQLDVSYDALRSCCSSRIAAAQRGKKHLRRLILVAMHVCVLLGHAGRPMVICRPVEALASFSCAPLYTIFHTHNCVRHIFHTQLYHTHNSSHTICLTSRSSTTSFVFPSFPVPLQLLFLIIGRS